MISERSCDTEDLGGDAENSPQEYNLKYTVNEKQYYYCYNGMLV